MSWECIDCGETDINMRLTAQAKKCVNCRSRQEIVRGAEKESWDVQLSAKFRREYEQRQCAKTETGIISAILRIMG